METDNSIWNWIKYSSLTSLSILSIGHMGWRTWRVASGGWDKGGCGWWSRWGRACRCHSRLLRPYLLQLFWTANGILMTPADLQPREAQGLALHCGRLRGVKSSGDTEAARADRTQARQQLWKVCVRAKSLLSVYFWAHACYCAINNGWGRWWECSTGNRKRHPCHPLKSRNSEYSGEGKEKKNKKNSHFSA